MNNESLIPGLQNNFSLSLKASKKFAEAINIISIEKGSNFIQEGKANAKEYLVIEGICRSYLLNEKGNEITLSFFMANTPISPNLTRTKSGLSMLNFQALTEVKLATFTSENLMNLMMADREMEMWGNSILQMELMQKVNKEIKQISMNAKDRLIDFREQYPALENLIPHSYISSYLGITNVSLSRLRKELASN